MGYLQTQNPNLVQSWECIAMKDVGKFYGHLVYFSAISYILWPFGIFYGHLVYIFCGRFGTFFLKSGNPALSCFEFLCCVFISRKESTKGEQIAAIELPDKKVDPGQCCQMVCFQT
jgi:hypothetical protein